MSRINCFRKKLNFPRRIPQTNINSLVLVTYHKLKVE
uniref:Uncharacterized protein n=1 Tax=Arundo donax TaxID=35708 RepID=A0A0A9ELW0_ARUDO